MRALLTILAILMIALSPTKASAQPASTQAFAPTEAELRAWVRVLSKRPTSQTYQAYSAAMMGLQRMDQDSALVGEAWLNQVLICLLEVPDDARRADTVNRLVRATTYFAQPELPVTLNFLVGQKNSNNVQVARVADEFLKSYLRNNSDKLADTLRSYLGQLRGREPSWKVVRILYEPDPDRAMEELAGSKVNGSDGRVQSYIATRAGFTRDRKELEYLLISWNQAKDESKSEWRDKIVAKLSAMADYAEWFVRAYAAVILLRESRNLGNPVNGRLEDPALVAKLRQDANPFVAELGKEISPTQP